MYSFKENKFWEPASGDFLQQRKDEWRHIVKNLRITKNEVPAKAHKYHKHLYFTGEIHPDLLLTHGRKYIEMLSIGGFERSIFFHMWYHPEPSLELFSSMLKTCASRHDIGNIEYRLLRAFMPRDFSHLYGMMGGREELVVKTLYPSLDFRETFTIRGSERSLGVSPSKALNFCPAHTYNILDSELNCNPFSPGRYLWSHLDFGIENYWDEIIQTNNVNRRFFFVFSAFRRVLDFYDRDGSHQEREPAIELREELFEQFEAGGFGKFLTKLWKEEKARYENGDPTPTEVNIV